MAVTATCQKLLCDAEQIQEKLKGYESKIPNQDIGKQFFAARTIPTEFLKELAKLQQKVELLFLSNEIFDVNDVNRIAKSTFESRMSIFTISTIEKEIQTFKKIYDQTVREAQQDKKKALHSIRDTIISRDKKNLNPAIVTAYFQLVAEISRVTADEGYQIKKEFFITSDYSELIASNPYSRDPTLDSKIKQLKQTEIELYKITVSDSEFDAKFLSLFEELRTLARNNPGLKERDASFFNLYSDVFNLLVNRQTHSKDISASFVKVLEKTKPFQCGTPLEDLQKALALLQQDQPNDFDAAIIILKTMDYNKVTCFFPMSNYRLQAISDRVYFHLHNIHSIEEPHRITSSSSHGYAAFMEKDGATHPQRCRALQRAITELALFDLENAVDTSDAVKTIASLKVLEEIKLPPIAEDLFRGFQCVHIKTRNDNPVLTDPNLPEFNGNFGKAAFSLFTGGVLKKSKLEAVNQVYQTLRTVWQIY